jgi:type IV pilus assembly protein PilA
MRVLKWVAIVLLLLILIVGGGVFLVEIPFRLAFGWIFFLRDNFATLEVNLLRVAEALACIAALGLGGHFFARWLYRQMAPAAAPWRPGWTVAGLGAVLLLFVAGIGTVGITHQTAWLFTDPGPLLNDSMGYGKRARVSEAILAASAARTAVAETFVKSGRLPASDAEAGLARADPESRYVKTVSVLPGGVVRIEVAEVIQEGGIITFTPTPKDGGLEWKCSSANMQKRDLPGSCRE